MNPFEINRTNRTIYTNRVTTSSKIQLPNLPLLGQLQPSDFLMKLQEIINEEATAYAFYKELYNLAPNKLHKEFVEEAMKEEKEHLEMFKKLYTYFTGKQAEINPKKIKYNDYKQGILLALKDELEASDKYKKMILSTTDELVKQSFFNAMVDEKEHATMFSTLYSSLQ